MVKMLDLLGSILLLLFGEQFEQMLLITPQQLLPLVVKIRNTNLDYYFDIVRVPSRRGEEFVGL